MTKLQNILITGGAGFIGSHLIELLMQETDWTIVNVDKLTYAGKPESLVRFHNDQRYQFEQLDLCDAVRLNKLITEFNPDAVFHLAAESHVDRSILGPEVFIDSNIKGTFNLLQSCLKHWEALPENRQSLFQLVHVSTDEVFGSLGQNDEPCHEESPYLPRSPYSASKAAADHLVSAWQETFGLPAIITRCANNYGPRQHSEKLIPVVIEAALANRPIPVYGDGTNIRDWIHVTDHAWALLEVMLKGKVGESYNIAADCQRTNIEVVHLICNLLDELLPRATPYSALIEFVPDRPGHDFRYAMNTYKIESELGWKPKVTFEQGLRETVLAKISSAH